MSVVSRDELLSLVGRAQRAWGKVKAGAYTPRSGAFPIRMLSRHRTSDRMGVRAYEPGDPLAHLVRRDLIVRDQLVVRTFHRLSDVRVHGLLDPSPSLLGDPRTGPFAVKLMFCLALASLRGGHATGLSFFGRARATSDVRRVTGFPVLLNALAALEPVPRTPDEPAVERRLAASIPGSRANLNLFVIMGPDHPAERLARLLGAAHGVSPQTIVFLPIGVHEFYEAGPLVCERGGGPLHTADVRPFRYTAEYLGRYLDDAVVLGGRIGVRVEPLIIDDPDTDIDTMLESLTGLLP